MDTSNKLFFTEGYKAIEIRGIREHDPYEQKITIADAIELLKPYNIYQKWFTTGDYIFEHIDMEIRLWVKPISGQDGKLNYDDTSRLVGLMFIHILPQLNEQDLQIIEAIMKRFNLNVYHINTKKHCKDTNEVKELLKELGLYYVPLS